MDIKTYNSLNALRTYLHECYSNIFNNNTSMRKDCLATTEAKDYMSTICIHIQYDIFFHVPINNVLSFTKHNRLQHIPKSPHTHTKMQHAEDSCCEVRNRTYDEHKNI